MTDAQPGPEQSQNAPAKSSAFTNPKLLWGIIAVLVVIAGAAGFFLLGHGKSGSLTVASSERSICQATLDRVRDYGVVPFDTTLANPDPDKNENQGLATCHARSGPAQYAMTVELRCDDMAKATCLDLYSVQQNDGTSLYQRAR